MSAAAASSRVTAIAWRTWWRPALLVAWATLIVVNAVFAIGPRFDADYARKQREFALLMAMTTAVCSGFGGLVIGLMWKDHLCRPIARLAPGWGRAHALMAAAATALQIGANAAADSSVGGTQAAASAALVVGATALGVAAPFGNREFVIFVLALYGPVLAGVSAGALAFEADLVLGARPLALVAVLAAALALAARGLARAFALDEDDAFYYVRLSFAPSHADAIRSSWLVRAMRRWDAWRALDESAPRPLRGGAFAWALHRRRALQQVPWQLSLIGNAAFMSAFAALLGPPPAIRLGLTLIALAPAGVIAPLLQPAYRAVRPLEALRPWTRRREMAVLALAVALVQMRALASAGAATAALIAATGTHAAWRDWILAAALGAASMPLTIAAELAAANSGFAARVAIVVALGALWMAALVQLQDVGPAPGWAYAALLIAGVVAGAVAWRRLIRIDID